MKPETVVFDLDGTLWDTSAVCADAWNAVVARLGIHWRTVVADDVRRVAGRPHQEAIDAAFAGLDRDSLLRLGEATQTEDNLYLARHGGSLYPGVREWIPWLAERYPLLIVSNCQAGYIEVFRDTSGLGNFFVDDECWGRTGNAKPANLQSLLRRNTSGQPVMVGDTDGDSEAARFNGIPFIHASYGFGKVDQPDATISTFADLPGILDRMEGPCAPGY